MQAEIHMQNTHVMHACQMYVVVNTHKLEIFYQCSHPCSFYQKKKNPWSEQYGIYHPYNNRTDSPCYSEILRAVHMTSPNQCTEFFFFGNSEGGNSI